MDKLIPHFASESRDKAKEVQVNNLQKAYDQIKTASEQGFEETVLFGIWLGSDQINSLMNKGYSVTYIHHPFEQRKMIKVSWS